jgi:hypothetical protein
MSRFDDAPDQYWHCYVGSKDASWLQKARDMTKQELLDKVVQPWRERRPFIVGGTVFRDHDQIAHVKIVQTSKPSTHYLNDARARGKIDFEFADFREGEDFTDELLASALAAKAPSTDVALLLQLCTRLPNAARPLARRRKGKEPFEISDEYDAQDLLHAIVRAYFKYAVNEEPIKKLANTKSTRADFAIEALGTIIELKYARDPNDQARIVDELAQDLLYYEQWEHLKVFIYVVYNASDLNDPEALDRLSGVRSHGDKQYEIHIVRA